MGPTARGRCATPAVFVSARVVVEDVVHSPSDYHTVRLREADAEEGQGAGGRWQADPHRPADPACVHGVVAGQPRSQRRAVAGRAARQPARRDGHAVRAPEGGAAPAGRAPPPAPAAIPPAAAQRAELADVWCPAPAASCSDAAAAARPSSARAALWRCTAAAVVRRATGATRRGLRPLDAHPRVATMNAPSASPPSCSASNLSHPCCLRLCLLRLRWSFFSIILVPPFVATAAMSFFLLVRGRSHACLQPSFTASSDPHALI